MSNKSNYMEEFEKSKSKIVKSRLIKTSGNQLKSESGDDVWEQSRESLWLCAEDINIKNHFGVNDKYEDEFPLPDDDFTHIRFNSKLIGSKYQAYFALDMVEHSDLYLKSKAQKYKPYAIEDGKINVSIGRVQKDENVSEFKDSVIRCNIFDGCEVWFALTKDKFNTVLSELEKQSPNKSLCIKVELLCHTSSKYNNVRILGYDAYDLSDTVATSMRLLSLDVKENINTEDWYKGIDTDDYPVEDELKNTENFRKKSVILLELILIMLVVGFISFYE